MEEIISELNKSLLNDENHSEFYKYRGENKHDQEHRRLNLLKSQKDKRGTTFDDNRGIIDLIESETSRAQYKELHNSRGYQPKSYVAGFHKTTLFYANTLMLSEWMLDKPADLESDWYVLACPKGKRILLVANNGVTKAYLKYGTFFKEWESCLPGGNYNNSSKYCVLDCIMTDEDVIYVLDVLAWGNISMTECEHEFRYFWLISKFSENNYSDVTNNNEYPIRLIERCDSNKENLNSLLSNWPAYPDNRPAVDGLLFYHKKAFYVKNYTPLVVWLFPFMVNESISEDIQVHVNYLKQKPADFVNNTQYIEEFELNLSKKMKKTKKNISNSFSSSRSSSNSSLNSSNASLTESFGSGKVHYVFRASTNDEKTQKNKKKNKKKSKKSTAMETDNIADVSTDSAVGLMDDSISESILNVECPQGGH